MHILGIFRGIFLSLFTLYSPRNGPRTFWDFSQHFLKSISLYIVLGAGHAQFGNFGGFLWSISFYVVLGAGRAQFGIFGGVFRVLFHFI